MALTSTTMATARPEPCAWTSSADTIVSVRSIQQFRSANSYRQLGTWPGAPTALLIHGPWLAKREPLRVPPDHGDGAECHSWLTNRSSPSDLILVANPSDRPA